MGVFLEYWYIYYTIYVISTPATKYSQRKRQGQSVASLNTAASPSLWTRTACDMGIKQFKPMKDPAQYMFQKVSQKALSKF